MVKRTSCPDPTILDGSSLFEACETTADRFDRDRITLDYARLGERLEAIRRDAGWRESKLTTVLLAMDPNSEGQQRFQTMLRHSGFEPDVIHYRNAFVSLSPGRSPGEMGSKPTISLASRVAYIAGLMARHTDPNFLVVSHSFELYGPLTDLKQRVPDGRVGVAYFASLIDYRWRSAGLIDGELDVEFFDLDPFSQDLLGVDLAGTLGRPEDESAGLSRF
jgi:hypothetical protein